ncbi:MAG TPA: MarR family winged helix-turn-helix transcriptional regulator [Streptosporangiaceae bacterium]
MGQLPGFVDPDGTPLRDLQEQARLTNLAGLQRWRYVVVEPDPADARPAPPRRDWVVRPTRAGRQAQAVWSPLPGLIEERWHERFGAAEAGRLAAALRAIAAQLDVELPRYLPVAGVSRQDQARWPPRRDAGALAHAGPLDLSALLSQVLLAFTIDFERESRLSLAISANALRVLGEQAVRVRDLPGLTGVSTEAVAVSVKFLERHGCLVVEPDPAGGRARLARLTPRGQQAQARCRQRLAAVEEQWRARFGAAAIAGLRSALADLVGRRDAGQPRLGQGLVPYPDGWRAHPPYVTQTRSLVADAVAALPHYPMVSHRGGFPDGA